MADDLATFAEFYGIEQLNVQATSKVTTLLGKMCDISLKQTLPLIALFCIIENEMPAIVKANVA